MDMNFYKFIYVWIVFYYMFNKNFISIWIIKQKNINEIYVLMKCDVLIYQKMKNQMIQKLKKKWESLKQKKKI